MKTCLLFVIALSLAIGCTSTYVVDSSQAVLWIPKAQKQLLGEDVNVRTASGEEFSGTLQLLNVDSLRVWNGDDKEPVEIGLSNVSYVGRSPNYAVPIFGGLGGLVAGGAIGGAFGSRGSAPWGGLEGAVIGAPIGFLLGITIGGAATTVDQYEITHWRKREMKSEVTDEETNERQLHQRTGNLMRRNK